MTWSSPPIGEAVLTPEVVVHEEWRVVDQWWTDTPIARQYRYVTRGGRKITEVRERDDESWQDTGLPEGV